MNILNSFVAHQFCGIDVRRPWAGVLTVTPADARHALEMNKGNCRSRVIRQHVNYLVRCIQGGEWQPGHPQPVVFSDAGRLVDGQHRMEAIAEAGVPVSVSVTCGVPDSMAAYLDTGIPRQLNDRMRFSNDPVTNKHIARLVNAYAWIAGKIAGARTRLTPEQAEGIFGEHKRSIIFASQLLARCQLGVSRSAVAVALAEMHERNAELAEKFMVSLCTVDGELQPARVLRDYLLTHPTQGGKGDAHNVYKRSVAAMKASLEGRDVKVLRATEW